MALPVPSPQLDRPPSELSAGGGALIDHTGLGGGDASLSQLERGEAPAEVTKSEMTEASNKEEVDWVTWDGPDDPANPLNWSRKRKWLLSLIGIMFCCLVSMTVSGYTIAEGSMQTDLHTSKIMVALGVTLFTVTFGAAPLVLAPISEVYGRWGVYIISMVLFTLLFIPAALTKTIGGMLVTRFVSGIFGSTGISVTGGTLSDLWSSTERGLPMAIFSFGAFAATGLGPVIFGIVEQKYGFRIVFWMMFAGSGAFTALICILMRETRASVLLSRKAARLRKETGSDRYRSQSDLERKSIKLMVRTSLVRPIHMLVTEPVLIAFTLWFSFAWASLNGALQQQVLTVCFQIIMYILLQSVSLVFGGIYGFDISESGYLFVAQPIAAAFGLVINHWTNKLYLKRVAKRGPEARLYMAMCAGIIMPTGAWIYAWTARASVHWIVPTIGTVLIYTGMFGIFLTCFSYIADSYTVYAASALSATNFARNLIAAFAPLYAADLYNRLGLAGGGSLLAGLTTLLSLTPFLLYHFGSRLRARSAYVQAIAKMTA